MEIEKINHKLITKSCPECNIVVDAKDFVTLLENMQRHISECKVTIETKINNET